MGVFSSWLSVAPTAFNALSVDAWEVFIYKIFTVVNGVMWSIVLEQGVPFPFISHHRCIVGASVIDDGSQRASISNLRGIEPQLTGTTTLAPHYPGFLHPALVKLYDTGQRWTGL